MNRFNIVQLNKYIELSKFTCEKHPSENLYIYGYDGRKSSGNPIIWDDLNIHLRGLILDGNGKVIQRSFPKFYTFKNYITKTKINLTENQTIKLPDGNFKIYEKLDGSMAILYWINEKPYLASQRAFTSPNAIKATEILNNKYSHVFNKLNKNYTYIFEAIYPNSRVMVNYSDKEDLVLLGIIEIKTGKSVPLIDIGFPIAKDYTKKYGHINDLEELANLNLPNLEGFVLQYDNGLRLKLKFPWFSEAHKVANNIITYNRLVFENKQKLNQLLNLQTLKISNLTVWECLKSGKQLESILVNIPEEFYTCGFEFWFFDILKDLKNKFNKLKIHSSKYTDSEIWSKIKPKELLVFDVDLRKNLPQHSTILWNFLSRINNNFL